MRVQRPEAGEGPATGPAADRVSAVWRRLRDHMGGFAPRRRGPIVDQVVGTVLSQHTSDINSGRAFARLRERFPRWEQVVDAPHELVADAIRCGGIADRKARTIQRILGTVEDREGRVDLERLRELDDDAVEEYLTSLPGVGPKTAACVLVFAMERDAFPVDTHVHRVTARLGWIPPGTSAEKAHRLLAAAVPPGIRYELHLALIAHGRTVCRAQRPRCGECVLLDLCPYGSALLGGRATPGETRTGRETGKGHADRVAEAGDVGTVGAGNRRRKPRPR